MLERAAQIQGERWIAVELTLADAPALQAFFEANPKYSEDYFGRPWPADAGLRELSDRPPAEWPQGESRHWAAIERGTGRWLAMLAFVEDLLAPHVWHVGWLLVDRRQRGSGLAGEIYSAWEAQAPRNTLRGAHADHERAGEASRWRHARRAPGQGGARPAGGMTRGCGRPRRERDRRTQRRAARDDPEHGSATRNSVRPGREVTETEPP